MTRARILLLHGFLSGASAWDRLRSALPGYDLVAPDLPGFGRAPDPGPEPLEGMLEYLEPLVADFGPEHVVGHSMGAILALGLAVRHPERFRSLGLIGLPVYASRQDGLEFLHRRGWLHRGLLHSEVISHGGCMAMYRLRRAWTPLIPVFARRQTPQHLHAAFLHSRAGHDAINTVVFAGHVPPLAHAVRTPVAVLHGARDPSARIDRVEELAGGLGWRMRVVEGANHQVHIERPRATARWIREVVVGE